MRQQISSVRSWIAGERQAELRCGRQPPPPESLLQLSEGFSSKKYPAESGATTPASQFRNDDSHSRTANELLHRNETENGYRNHGEGEHVEVRRPGTSGIFTGSLKTDPKYCEEYLRLPVAAELSRNEGDYTYGQLCRLRLTRFAEGQEFQTEPGVA